MATADHRREPRFNLSVSALATNRAGGHPIACTIQDGSISGCKIACADSSLLPASILLKVPAISKPIRGVIMWRKDTMAGVKFEWGQRHKNERRGAPRQNCQLEAVVFDLSMRKLMDCAVCDASATGCRITSPGLSDLPDAVYLQITGLTTPALANVVWKQKVFAGVEFVWDNDIFDLNQ